MMNYIIIGISLLLAGIFLPLIGILKFLSVPLLFIGWYLILTSLIEYSRLLNLALAAFAAWGTTYLLGVIF